MASIYSLESRGFIWYVGSTRDAANRERQHRSRHDIGVGASLIPDEYEWEFKVLETCVLDQRLDVERKWYDILHPIFNKQVPGTGHDAEWKRKNPERVKESSRLYRENNVEKLKQQTLAWRLNNKDRHQENKKRWNEENKERINAQRRARYAAKKNQGAS